MPDLTAIQREAIRRARAGYFARTPRHSSGRGMARPSGRRAGTIGARALEGPPLSGRPQRDPTPLAAAKRKPPEPARFRGLDW